MPCRFTPRSLFAAALVGLASGPGPAAHAAQSLSVRCDLSSYHVGTDVCTLGEVANEYGLPGYTAQVRAGDAANPVAGADSEIIVRQGYGDVGVSLDASAFAYDQYFARGTLRAIIGFNDRVVVRSGLLAEGAPVQVTLTHRVEAQVLHGELKPGRYSSIFVRDRFYTSLGLRTARRDGQLFTSNDFYELVNAPQDDYLHVKDQVFDSFVGATLLIEYLMFAELQFEVSQPAMNIPDFTYLSHELRSLNSGHTYLDAGGAISFVGEQGTVYTAPPTAIPEPAVATLMLMGLAGLAGLARRRADPTSA